MRPFFGHGSKLCCEMCSTGQKNTKAHITRQLHSTFTRQRGFNFLQLFVCLWLTASGCEMCRTGNQKHESAHHIPHSLDSRDAPGPSPRANLCVGTLCLCLFVRLRFTASWCGVCGTFHNNVKAHITRQLHSTFTRKHNEKHHRSFFAVRSGSFSRCGRK